MIIFKIYLEKKESNTTYITRVNNNKIRVESNIMDSVVTYVVGKGKLKLLQNISVNTIKSNGQAISLDKNEKFIKSIKLSKKTCIFASVFIFIFSVLLNPHVLTISC